MATGRLLSRREPRRVGVGEAGCQRVLGHPLDGLAEGAWVGIVVGAIGAAGLWLTSDGRRAVGARRWLGPWLERADLAWAGFAVLLVAVVWALPLHRFVTTAVLVVLGAAGFEIARRQIVREYEEEGPALPGARREAPWRRAPHLWQALPRSSSALRACGPTSC